MSRVCVMRAARQAGLVVACVACTHTESPFDRQARAESASGGATLSSGGSLLSAGNSAAGISASGAQASAEPGANTPTGGAQGSASEACDGASLRRVRRLTQREVELTLADLLQTPESTFAWSAPDPKVQGFDTSADALLVGDGTFDDFADVAELAADASDVATLAPCAAGSPEQACALDFLVDFAGRAYGRAASDNERQRLLALYLNARATSEYTVAVRVGIQAILSSPYFLYRTELGATDEPATGQTKTSLSASEAANALAFAITGAGPDAALRERAIRDPNFVAGAGMGEEADRLIATPRAQAQLRRFVRQWLGVDDLNQVNKIPAMFPEFTPSLKADLDREIESYLTQALAPGQGTLAALLAGRFGFPSALEFTTLYSADYPAGTAPLPGADFAPLELSPGVRRGVLSLPGWLAAHSPVHRSSPTDRGLAIRSRLFCQTLPSPPANALAAAPGPGDTEQTTRQKFERHASDAACSGCHSRMDPLGFGLEMMDAVGRYRETENGLAVDSNGTLSGTDVDGAFRGPAELADRLAASRMVRDCFTLQLFRYVMGRDQGPGDECALRELRAFFADEQRTIAELLVEIVKHGQFTARSYEP